MAAETKLAFRSPPAVLQMATCAEEGEEGNRAGEEGNRAGEKGNRAYCSITRDRCFSGRWNSK